ncbi:hypothetical protein [Parasphingorhabdus sp.]|uniref:hypothetical protein n=1 Tax=Parasphingorhabdus sp. TaxID=2709688 RepID=UPI00359472C3
MTPIEAIQAATRNAALALGRERDVGAIAVGLCRDRRRGRRFARRCPPARTCRCRDHERQDHKIQVSAVRRRAGATVR